jgi:hypothetical protein
MPQFSARWAAPLFPSFVGAHVLAQVFIGAQAFGQTPEASEHVPKKEHIADAPAARAALTGSFRPGFEAGVRVAAALPIGKAGRDVDGADRRLGDLTAWRAPLELNVAYRVSSRASYGLYGQLGLGGTGSGCTGRCDFSDLRLGVLGQWHFHTERNVSPWLGLGAGWESLSYRTLAASGAQSTELLGGPELLLQGGLELRVERDLLIGPFVSAGVGSYLLDSYKCLPQGIECPAGSAVAGSGLHSWLGFGLSARYSP